MANQFEQYMFEGTNRWVRLDMRARHVEHCLCHACEKFRSDNGTSCEHAQLLFDTARLFHVVIAVWECPGFVEEERTDDEGLRTEDEGPGTEKP